MKASCDQRPIAFNCLLNARGPKNGCFGASQEPDWYREQGKLRLHIQQSHPSTESTSKKQDVPFKKDLRRVHMSGAQGLPDHHVELQPRALDDHRGVHRTRPDVH